MTVPPEVAQLGHTYLATWLLGAPLVFGFFAVEASSAPPAIRDAVPHVGRIGGRLDLCWIRFSYRTWASRGRGAGVGDGARGGFLLGIVIALRRGLIRIAAPDWGYVATIIRIGAPLSLAGVLLSAIYMFLTRVHLALRHPAAGGAGVGHKMEGWGSFAISGFSLAASALVGAESRGGQERGARGGALTVHTAGRNRHHRGRLPVIPQTFVALFTPTVPSSRDGVLYLRVIAFGRSARASS